MSSVAIDLDRLEADIEKKRRELEELEAAATVLKSYRASGVQVIKTGFTPTESDPVISVEPSTLKGMKVHEAAQAVLEAAHRNLKTKEIVDSLQNAGFGKGLKHIHNAVFTALARKTDLFTKIAPGVWGLKE